MDILRLLIYGARLAQEAKKESNRPYISPEEEQKFREETRTRIRNEPGFKWKLLRYCFDMDLYYIFLYWISFFTIMVAGFLWGFYKIIYPEEQILIKIIISLLIYNVISYIILVICQYIECLVCGYCGPQECKESKSATFIMSTALIVLVYRGNYFNFILDTINNLL